MPDKILDAKGLNCPLPILKAKKALQDVPAGGTLEVWATDPGSVADFTAFCAPPAITCANRTAPMVYSAS